MSMQGLPGETKGQLLVKVTKFLMREVQTVIYTDAQQFATKILTKNRWKRLRKPVKMKK